MIEPVNLIPSPLAVRARAIASFRPGRHLCGVELRIIDNLVLLPRLNVVPSLVESVNCLASIEHAKVQVLQLRQAVLEQEVLGADKLLTPIHLLLEENRGRFVLQTSHLKRLHQSLVVVSWLTSLAVSV